MSIPDKFVVMIMIMLVGGNKNSDQRNRFSDRHSLRDVYLAMVRKQSFIFSKTWFISDGAK